MAPTDFSEPSLDAVDYAAGLSRHFGADMQLLHVVIQVQSAVTPGFPHSVRTPDRQKEIEDEALRKLRNIASERLPAELPIEFIVIPGDAVERIPAIAREKNSDLIVISTHGQGGFKRALFGSVADGIIRNAHCPVLSSRFQQ